MGECQLDKSLWAESDLTKNFIKDENILKKKGENNVLKFHMLIQFQDFNPNITKLLVIYLDV